MPSILKPTRRWVTWMFLREILSPSILMAFAVVLTLPYWMFPLVYFLMQTLLIAPSGAFIWLLIIVLAGYILWAWGTWFALLGRRKKARRALRDQAIADDEVAAKEHLALRLSGLPTWRIATAFIGLQILLAPAVALVLWQGMIESPGIIREHGRVRRATPWEELILNLRHWKPRGIWRPLNSHD